MKKYKVGLGYSVYINDEDSNWIERRIALRAVKKGRYIGMFQNSMTEGERILHVHSVQLTKFETIIGMICTNIEEGMDFFNKSEGGL